MTELIKEDLNWCLRRLPKVVMDILKENPGTVFVSGGFVRSCVSGEEVNDIDIFSSSEQSAELLARRISDENHHLIKTENAFTVLGYKYTLQFIFRWSFKTPSECIESFDFTIAKAAIWDDGKAYQSLIDERFYIDLAAKRLVYCCPQRNEDAGGSMLRLFKFYQRGYRAPLSTMGAVIARLIQKLENRGEWTEDNNAKIITGLLRDVDPSIDPEHYAH
jgi:hypothetical protein